MLVAGGPECFGEIGKKTGAEPIAMNYDQQLYIYDLSSGEAAVTLRSSCYESACWVDVEDGVLVDEFFGQYRHDHFFDDLFSQCFI